jgi:hypothetical protein
MTCSHYLSLSLQIWQQTGSLLELGVALKPLKCFALCVPAHQVMCINPMQQTVAVFALIERMKIGSVTIIQ